MRGEPPRLLRMLKLQGTDAGIFMMSIQLGRKACKLVLQRRWHLLKITAQRQVVREAFELPCKQAQRVEAQRGERVRSHLGRHARMPVAVATDPGAEADHRRHVFQVIEREASLFPCFAKVRVRPRNRFGKNFAQVEQRVFQFLVDAWASDMDLTGAPQRFQSRLQRAASALALPFGKGRVFTLLHDVVNLAMAFAHGLTFRLGRVGGEHRLEPHLPQHLKNALRIKPHVAHRRKLVGPEAFLRSGAMGFFAPAPDLRRHAFFDDVQKLKRDRVGLTQPAIDSIGGGQRFAAPWQAAGKVAVAEAGEHRAE